MPRKLPLLLLAAWIDASSAATLTVNSSVDAVDASPGDGICATATAGQCSLRAALMEANAAPEFDSISLPAGVYALTRAGRDEDASASGDLDISSNLAIVGAGPDVTVIDAQGLDRVMHVQSDATATAIGVRLIGGGGVETGGGLMNAGIFALEASVVEGNGGASGSDAVRLGAGIYNSGALVLTASIVRGNIAGRSGIAGVAGGGIYNLTGITINLCLIDDNDAIGVQAVGGGVASSGVLQMSTSEINHNTAVSGAGMLQTSGSMFINASTLHDNVASQHGGALRVVSGSSEIVNSTLFANHANGDGGAIAILGGDLQLRNATLAANRADADGNGNGIGGALAAGGNSAVLRNSLFADNLRGVSAEDCSGAITSLGYNLFEAVAGCSAAASDRVATEAMLGAIRISAVAPPVYSLQTTSPAIDAAHPDGCLGTQDTPLLTDEIGTRRPNDGDGDLLERCDIGAFEYFDDALFADGFD